jgi:hypothetical protein
MDDLNIILGALDKLERSAAFAQRYGPYFFALALLVVGPFLCRLVFARSLSAGKHRASDPQYQDFRFYFRSTITVGLLCVVAGVAWFFFENFRQVAQTNELVAELKKKVAGLEASLKGKSNTFAGLISSGLDPRDELHITFIDPKRTLICARVPQSSSSWYFVVVSDEELSSPFEVYVGWSHGSPDIAPIPVQITLLRPASATTGSIWQAATPQPWSRWAVDSPAIGSSVPDAAP